MRRPTLLFALLLGLLASLAGPAAAQTDADYIRFSRTDDTRGKLQVARVTYRSPETKVEVTLYGVIHIADPAFFRKVQSELERFDLVLCEGGGEDAQGKAPPKAAGADPMAAAMGLQDQGEGLDYTRLKFRWADYDSKTAAKIMARVQSLMSGPDGGMGGPGGGEMPAEMQQQMQAQLREQARALKAQFDRKPAERERMKYEYAVSSTRGPGLMAADARVKKLMIDDRNKIAITMLEAELAKRTSGKLAILYGAGHNADFDVRLRKLGFVVKEKVWLTAWDIGGARPAPAEKPVSPKPEKTYY